MRFTIKFLLLINLFFLIEFKISSIPSSSIAIIIMNIFFILFSQSMDSAQKHDKLKRGK
jgi:hypothetical protein